MGTKLTNNATGRLAVSLTAASTQLSMVVGDAVKFPTIAEGSGDNFPLTAVKANGELEIMLCTLTNGNVFTVQRGQEGTSPKAFSAGDRIELRLTAGTIDGMIDDRIDAAIDVVLEDLGTAAYADLTTSPLDTTAGRALKVGDFGLGTTTPPELQRKDDYAQSVAQFFTVSGADVPTAWGQDGASTGGVIMPRATRPVALYFGNNNKLKISHFGGSSWSEGAEFYHSGNKPNWRDINEIPNLVETSRTITAGTGLTGGGNLSANRTLNVEYGTTEGTAAQGDDNRITGAMQKANNLSDVVSAATARSNLGLKSAATRDVGDSTGNVMQVGAFGLGEHTVNNNSNLQALSNFSPNSLPTGYPGNAYGYGTILRVFHGYSGDVFELVSQHTYNSPLIFRHSRTDTWKTIYHTGNPPPTASHNHDAGDITSGTINGERMPMGAGGVGTYAFVTLGPGPAINYVWNTTTSGANLRVSDTGVGYGSSLSGTWRILGYRTFSSVAHATLAVRIS